MTKLIIIFTMAIIPKEQGLFNEKILGDARFCISTTKHKTERRKTQNVKTQDSAYKTNKLAIIIITQYVKTQAHETQNVKTQDFASLH